MAIIQSNGTGGGNWSTGASWSGGSVPASTDDAQIVNGDTITKDTAKGSPDCARLIVDAGGTLAIGANGVKASSDVENQGKITGAAGGELEFGAHSNGGSEDGEWDIDADGGTAFLIEGNNARFYFEGNRSNGGPCNFVNVRFHDMERINCRGLDGTTVFQDCEFDDAKIWPLDNTLFEPTFRGCTFKNDAYAIRPAYGCAIRLEECDVQSTINTLLYADRCCEVHAVNCLMNAVIATFGGTNRSVLRSVGHGQVEGDWLIEINGAGKVLKSTAAKKDGDYGVEMVPYSGCGEAQQLAADIQIPVASGDSVSPSLYVKNATADLDLQDASDRMVFILDPGDEWGLHEEIDASTLSDVYNNWRQVSFTGGTVGGTSKKGLLTIRIYLKRYVASAVVYVADPEV